MKLKCAVAGLGTNGAMHYAQLKQMDSVDIVAVSDPRLDELSDHVDLSGVEHTFTDYDALLGYGDFEAIFIFTPSGQHIGHIRKAAAAKKHIFCEKPLGKDESIGECQATLDFVRQQGVKLQIGFNRRFDPQFRDIHERVKAGEIGRPHIVRVVARDPFVLPYDFIRNSGGLIQDFAAHDFDMVSYQAGSRITEIYLQGTTLIDPGLAELNDIDTLTASCKLEKDGFGLIDESRKAVYGYDQRVEVFGEKGMLKAENVTESTVELYNDEAISLRKPLDYYLNRFKQAYIFEKASFIDSVVNDRPIVCTGEEALNAMRCCIAAQRSLDTGLPVKVSYE